jgi:hypothetical protein
VACRCNGRPRLAEAAAKLLKATAKLHFEPPLGGLVETLALEPLREDRLIGHAAGLVVRVDVADPAPEPARSRIVGVLQI